MKKFDKDISSLSLEYTIETNKCPCGSGKTPKKCCGPIKPRKHFADIDPRNYIESDGLAIGLDYSLKRIVNGEILPLIGKPVLIHGYDRPKSKKVIAKGTQLQEWVMHPDSLITGFDNIYIIDTNTMKMHEHEVSISCILHCLVKSGSDNISISYAPIAFFEFWNANVNAEKIGWYALIEAIKTSPEHSNTRIGIVVDSFLDELETYNSFEHPYLEDNFLPSNIQFIYASDKGSNYINKLIKLCDKQARNLLKYRNKNADMDSLNKSLNYPCKYFRQLDPNDKSSEWRITPK